MTCGRTLLVLAPVLLPLAKTVGAEEPCGEAMLGFTLSNVESATPFDGLLGGPGAEGKVVVGAEEGTKGKARAFASIVTTIAEERYRSVGGWVLSIAVEGDAVPVGASFQRSAAAGYWRSGFDLTRIVDPEANEGLWGVVSHVILGLHVISTLPRTGTTAVLELEIEEAGPHGTADTAAILRFRDGLNGPSMNPVSNSILLSGTSVGACKDDSALLTVVFSLSAPRPFLRGDSNGDGELALSDAVFLLAGLFEEQRADTCPAASDANADGRVDISDAIYLLAYLFQGGPSPPAPFPDCGPDPAGGMDSLPCLEVPPTCR